MLRMPHLKTGDWEKSYDLNAAAMKADAAYRHLSPQQGAQHIYMTHNTHVGVFAALLGGREKEAMAAARNM